MAPIYTGWTTTKANADLDAIINWRDHSAAAEEELAAATLIKIVFGGVARTLGLARLAGWICRAFLGLYVVSDPKFGAVGGGVVDDSAGIQAAITAAAAAYVGGITTGAAVFFPSAVYRVDSGLTMPSNATRGIRFYGNGMTESVIRAGAAMTAVLTIGGATEQTTWPCLEHLGIDAAGLATYAVYGARVDNGYFHRIRVSGATAAGSGMSIGYGWSNRYVGVHFANNYGDGFQSNNDYSTSNNAADFIGCTALGNQGFGYRLRSGYGVRFFGGEVEQNQKGGIFATRQIEAISIKGVYFEQNGAAGYTFTSPAAVTVKAHILCGTCPAGAETTIGGGAPSRGGEISGCFCSSGGYEDAFIWASGLVGTSVRGNSGVAAAGAPIPLIKAYVHPSYGAIGELDLWGNQGFSADFAFQNIPTDNETALRRVRSSTVPQQNYAEVDFLRWALVSGGGGGTFRRSSSTYRGQPVWEIDGGTGTSHLYGWQFDIANYPTLQGKTVYFGAYLSQSDGTVGATLYAQGNSSGSGANANSGWRWSEAAVTLPSSGIVTFGFYGLAMAAGKRVRITEPVLAIVGASAEEMHSRPHDGRFRGSAMPTSGTWTAGDRVENLPGAVGQPKAWRRMTTGSAHVLGVDWASEGNL